MSSCVEVPLHICIDGYSIGIRYIVGISYMYVPVPGVSCECISTRLFIRTAYTVYSYKGNSCVSRNNRIHSRRGTRKAWRGVASLGVACRPPPPPPPSSSPTLYVIPFACPR